MNNNVEIDMEKNKIEQMFGEWVEVSNIGGDEAASGYVSWFNDRF